MGARPSLTLLCALWTLFLSLDCLVSLNMGAFPLYVVLYCLIVCSWRSIIFRREMDGEWIRHRGGVGGETSGWNVLYKRKNLFSIKN